MFLLWLFLILLAGVISVIGIGEAEKRSTPNIVLIVLDTVRADRVLLEPSASRNTMPFLGEMGRQGTVFRHARAPSNWTLPSHASIFTGMTPTEHGCHFEHRYLPDEAKTIAEVLAGHSPSYVTAGFSANVNVGRTFNLDQGFGNFYEVWSDPSSRQGGDVGELVLQNALRWLDHSAARPFFIFLNLMDAHLPYRAAPGFENYFGTPDPAKSALVDAPDLLDQVLAGKVEIDEGLRTTLDLRYDNAIRGLDDRLRRFVSALDERGDLENTVFIVTSDHGENLGDHGLVDHQGSLDESVLRVPLVMWGPGIPEGLVVDRPVSLTGLYRWILDLRDGNFDPRRTEGHRAPIAERMRPVALMERMLAMEPEFDSGLEFLRGASLVGSEGRWKLLALEGEEDRVLFVGESAKGSGEGAERGKKLREDLDGYRGSRVFLPDATENSPESPPEAEALQALSRMGYLGTSAEVKVGVHAQEHLSRGNRAYARGDLLAARKDFETAARLDPSFSDALFNLALVLDRLEIEQAQDVWTRYLKAARNSKDQDPGSIRHAEERVRGGR